MSAPILWTVLLGLGPSSFPMALTLINLRTRTHTGSSACQASRRGSAMPPPVPDRCCSACCTM